MLAKQLNIYQTKTIMTEAPTAALTNADPVFTIGDIPVETPPIAYGTYHLLHKLDAPAALDSLEAAAEAGITMFDMSDNYSGTELAIGRAVTSGILDRSKIIVATKTGLATTHAQQTAWKEIGKKQDTSPARLKQQVDASLRVLGDDVGIIDLYQLHAPDDNVPHEAHAETMSELIAAGKIREYGLSNYYGQDFADFLAACDERGLRRPVTTQPYLNLLSDTTAADIQQAQKEGVLVLAHSPLAKGVLTDTGHRALRKIIDTMIEQGSDDPEKTEHFNHLLEVSRQIDALTERAEALGRNLAQVAIGWLGMFDSTITLAATTNPSYLNDAINAAQWDLAQEPDLLEGIDTLITHEQTDRYRVTSNNAIRAMKGY